MEMMENRVLQTKRRELVAQQLAQTDEVLWKENGPRPQEVPHYSEWRRYVFMTKAQNSKLEYDGRADRRWEYFYQRERILKAKKAKFAAMAPSPPVPEPATVGPSTAPTPSAPVTNELKKEVIEEKSPSTQVPPAVKEKPKEPQPPPPPKTFIILKDEVSETYSFAGMHHIFVEHTKPVTRIEFAHNDKNLLAFSSHDGNISICNALHSPRLIRSLQGHAEAVTDFAWSSNNDLIVSSSVDKTVRLWQVRNGECIRIIKEKSVYTCCRFHPINNNLLFMGMANGSLQMFNSSTGKSLKKQKLTQKWELTNFTNSLLKPQNISTNLVPAASTLELNTIGTLMFVGDNRGVIHTYSVHSDSGNFELIGKTQVSPTGKTISSLNFKVLVANNQQYPYLLANSLDNSMRLFKLLPKATADAQLELYKQFKIPCSKELVRSNYCPLLTNREAPCMITGGEKTVVQLFDATKEQHTCVNKLQGHSDVVYDVCWNYDETLLASCDRTGTVILWKRVLKVGEDD